MIVKDLIKLLENYDQDMEVLLNANESICTLNEIALEKRGEESYSKTGYHPFDDCEELDEAVILTD